MQDGSAKWHDVACKPHWPGSPDVVLPFEVLGDGHVPALLLDMEPVLVRSLQQALHAVLALLHSLMRHLDLQADAGPVFGMQFRGQ